MKRSTRCGPGWRRCSDTKHGDVIVCATTACLRARLRTAPIRSRERQRADAQLLMTFCLKPKANQRVGRLASKWRVRKAVNGRSRLGGPNSRDRRLNEIMPAKTHWRYQENASVPLWPAYGPGGVQSASHRSEEHTSEL